MKDKLLIIGANGHGKVVADIALKMKKWNRIAFLDDNNRIKESLEIEVIGSTDHVFSYIDQWDIFVAIGDNSTRQMFQETLESNGASIPILVHPRAIIGEQVKIGQGTVIMAGSIINSSTYIGKGCIINTGSTIDHDNYIEDYVHISPGVNLAGSVKIGEGSWIGIGSVVINNIEITKRCKIGAGSVVVKSINEEGTYLGVPARRVCK